MIQIRFNLLAREHCFNKEPLFAQGIGSHRFDVGNRSGYNYTKI